MEPLRQQCYEMRPSPLGAMASWEIHVKGYVRAVGGDPWKTPISTLRRGRGNSIQSLIIPTPVGETPWHHQVELGDPSDHELCQLMEDLCQEIAHCELNVTPRSPPPMPLGHPSGSRNPNEDDQEVTFLREGGWAPLGQPSPSPAPAWPDGGWVTQGPPPQPQIPAQPNPHAGCLINTLASGLHLGTPRINTFSSKAMPVKTEVSFKQWNHEVQCVKDHYTELVVQESIVRFLKGPAADMDWYMGPTTSVYDILQTLSHFWHHGIFRCTHTKFL